MKPTYLTAVFCSAMVVVTPALAQTDDKADKAAARFEALDTDNSGEITLEEFAARRDARFSETDANADGVLSRDELLAAAARQNEERVARMIERFDENGDAVLSKDELPEPRRSSRRFERLDTDNSGGISLAEFQAVRGEHRGKRGKRRGEDG